MTKQLIHYINLAIAIVILVVACNSDTQLQNTQVKQPDHQVKPMF